jgi:hypothetical protein
VVMHNKAHSATMRRVAERFNARMGGAAGFDLIASDAIIEVETSATLNQGLQRLMAASGRRFVAVTNKEALPDAIRLTRATGIGVLGPRGEVVCDAARN